MKAYFYGPTSTNRAIIRTVKANTYLWGANTPASQIIVTPNPPTAIADDAYGFDTVIISTEY